MSGSSGTEERLEALVRELEPVRPIPRLRAVLGFAAALVPLAVLVHAFFFGGGGLRGAVEGEGLSSFLGILAGLLLLAGGALAAALARAVPGREIASRRGLVVAVAGGAIALMAAGAGVLRTGRGTIGLAECSGCIFHSVGLAVLPFAVVVGFVLQAFAARLGPAVLLGALGGVALGSAAVHLGCGSNAPMHWLVGHALGPVVLGMILALPVVGLLRVASTRPRRNA